MLQKHNLLRLPRVLNQLIKPSKHCIVVNGKSQKFSTIQYSKQKDGVRMLESRYFVRSTLFRPDMIWVADKNVAHNVFGPLIMNGIKNSKSAVIEYSAGAGYLSEYLLNANIENLYICETKRSFRGHLEYLLKRHGKDCLITNYHDLLRTMYRQKLNRPWCSDPPAHVILSLSSSKVLCYLVKSYLKREGLFEFGRPIFHSAVYPTLYHKYFSKDSRFVNPTRIHLANFFTANFIGVIDRESFFPRQKYRKIGEKVLQDERKLYVIQWAPLLDEYPYNMNAKDMKEFQRFISAITFRSNRKTSIIGSIEKYAAGFGIKMIQLGYSMNTLMSHLSGEEYITLFKELRQWSGYRDTIFNINDRLS